MNQALELSSWGSRDQIRAKPHQDPSLNSGVRTVGAVARLNTGGRITAVASCCGHQVMPGRIDREDGRILVALDPDHRDMYMSWVDEWLKADNDSSALQRERSADASASLYGKPESSGSNRSRCCRASSLSSPPDHRS